ncbi:DUF305 domain-containing protein [Arthrobacter sp. zg-Y411]|uniref:DUF305 domain-containing protein n=1 Tax=Arthrobacter TaxID=1663 RepID=UPI001D14E217|nr:MULTISPECIES: DUF305 domain-containing protein [Arthrobacter]MCC3295543.1 DUF305 domain-containing protein [Arthrobacter zhangbolii]MDN3905769.1 DUF305 domain-containing protein [Arthrobacter sp. YD2]
MTTPSKATSRGRSPRSLLRLLPALALAVVLSLSGCADTAAPETAPPTGPLGHNDADVQFAQSMIPHQQRAVEMSDMILAKEGVGPDVAELAGEIKETQGSEMDTLTTWLEARDQPAQATPDAETAEGEGLLSTAEVAALEAAQGTDASRIYLESMTVHHDAAIDKYQRQVGGGQNEEVLTLAHGVYEDRFPRIERMNALLAGL